MPGFVPIKASPKKKPNTILQFEDYNESVDVLSEPILKRKSGFISSISNNKSDRTIRKSPKRSPRRKSSTDNHRYITRLSPRRSISDSTSDDSATISVSDAEESSVPHNIPNKREIKTIKVYMTSDSCVICQDGLPEVMAIPCGHRSYCQECGPKIDVCSLCKTKIDHMVILKN